MTSFLFFYFIDSPIVGVGNVPINTLPSLNETLIEGMTPPPIFFCTGTGYPTPTLSWEYNGDQTLPPDVVQHQVHIIKMHMNIY